MSRVVHLDLELPDDVCAQLPESEIEAKAREALVMEFLRDGQVSQGKAAELLGVDRHKLFELMTKYQVAVIKLTDEELKAELGKTVPHS